MDENEDWTVWMGLRKAAVQVPIRLVIALGISWGSFWVLHWLIGVLEAQSGEKISVINMYGTWTFDGVFGGASGWLAGMALSRKLAENTGFIGSHLLVPVCVLFLAALVLAQHLTVTVVPNWQQVSWMVLFINGGVACVAAAKEFILDS